MMTHKPLQPALDALESRCGTHAEERAPGGMIESIRAALDTPERKPMTREQVRDMMDENAGTHGLNAFVLVAAVESFHGIKDAP